MGNVSGNNFWTSSFSAMQDLLSSPETTLVPNASILAAATAVSLPNESIESILNNSPTNPSSNNRTSETHADGSTYKNSGLSRSSRKFELSPSNSNPKSAAPSVAATTSPTRTPHPRFAKDVTRFAPSPTGSLHVGGVRTSLYCLLHARANKGRFIFRIEDTDQARSTDDATLGIERDMQWLGLLWDEGPGVPGSTNGPYLQSQRLDIYNKVIDQMLETGKAYLAWETKEELDQMRKEAEAAHKDFRYRPRTYSEAELAKYKEENRTPVVRIKAPNRDLVFEDEIFGEVTASADSLDDMVIRKADGFPTYQFAVVVDDHLMGVTLVLRGAEHLMNTPKQLTVYDALGWTPPKFGHMALIFDEEGHKMSKRRKAKIARQEVEDCMPEQLKETPEVFWLDLARKAGIDSHEMLDFMQKKQDHVHIAEAIAKLLDVHLPMIDVLDFRKRGYLPEALVNYVSLLGWGPGDNSEIMTPQELVNKFAVERVNKTPAQFDVVKLTWMNRVYIQNATDERLFEAVKDYIAFNPDSHLARLGHEELPEIIALFRTRISTINDLDRQSRFLSHAPESYPNKLGEKLLMTSTHDIGYKNLIAAKNALKNVTSWDESSIEAAIKSLGHDNLKFTMQPLRIALTGTEVSPPLYTIMAMLGQRETLRRIRACLMHYSDGTFGN